MKGTDKARFWERYWRQENERPALSITLVKAGREAAEPPRYLEAFEGGKAFGKTADKVARWADCREFLCEAVPYYAVSFGADDFAAFLGADLRLSADGTTSWPVRPLQSLTRAKIAFDPNGKWWTRTAEFYHVLRSRLGGSVMLAAPTLSAGLDGLAGLYGVNSLLTALLDEPEAVKEALEQINAAYTCAMKAVRELFEFDRYGSINRHGMYTEGATGVPQCDFSCMISGEMFREFALPCIRCEIAALDAAEYHLDGPGAIRHLEDLCGIRGLHTIQWVAGAGEAAEQDWTWLYRKINSLGKAVLAGGSPERVLRLQDSLRTTAAYYTVGAESRDEAERFLEAFGRIPIRRKGEPA